MTAAESVPLHTRLIPAAANALDAAMKRTGLSRTDTANRLIQIGGHISKEVDAGSTVIVRKKDGTEETVHFV